MPLAADPPLPRHPIRSALLADLERLLAARLDRLGWSDAQAFGRAVGRLAWRLPGRDKERSLEHLAIAFPAAGAGERERLARASFRHFGTSLAECLWLGERGPAEVARHVRVEGWEEIERARAERRPILVLSAHCGNWELIHAALNPRGLGLTPVARGLDDPALGRALLDFRSRMGTPTIVRGEPGAARDLLRALRSPTRALGILIDQDTEVEGVFVDFFGRPAWTPVGAAEIALRFGAAVLPTFAERLADGSHLVAVHPRLELPTDPVAATQAMTSAIEAQIRRVPEQWAWMHRRWRRQPPPAAGLPAAIKKKTGSKLSA